MRRENSKTTKLSVVGASGVGASPWALPWLERSGCLSAAVVDCETLYRAPSRCPARRNAHLGAARLNGAGARAVLQVDAPDADILLAGIENAAAPIRP